MWRQGYLSVRRALFAFIGAAMALLGQKKVAAEYFYDALLVFSFRFERAKPRPD
jgi:hypothetical protein